MAKKLADTIQTAIAFIQFINTIAPLSANQKGDPVTVEEAARELGVSPAEIIACIYMLNYECGDVLPEVFIEYDRETRQITPRRISYSFDQPLRLTSFEAHGLLNALSIAGYAQSDIYQTISGALPQLNTDKLNPMVRAHTNKKITTALKTLARAIRIQHAVHISYKKQGATESTHRDIEPYDIFFDSSSGAWLTTAWCTASQAWRIFRVDRIESCVLLDTPAHYNDSSVLDSSKTAVLLIHDPKAIQDAYNWHTLKPLQYSRDITGQLLSPQDIDRGAYLASISWYPNSLWLPQMILQTGGAIEAIAPLELRTTVHNLGLRAVAMLDNQ